MVLKLADVSGHGREELHLFCDEFLSGQRGIFIRRRIEKTRKISRETYRSYDHRIVRLLRKYLSVKDMRIRKVIVGLAAAREHRRTVFILQIHDFLRILSPRIVRTASDDADRNVRMTIPGIHYVHVLRRCRSILVDHHCKQVHLSPFHIFVEHVESQGIIYIIAYISLENDFESIGRGSSVFRTS